MADVDCFDLLKASFPNLKAEDLKAIRDELDNAKSKLFAPGTNDFGSAEFRKKAMALLKEIRFQEMASQLERGRNILTNQRNMAFLTQAAFKNDPERAIKALTLGGDPAITKAGSYSVGRAWRAMEGKILRPMLRHLDGMGAVEFMRKGVNDRAVAQEMWELTQGGNPGSSRSDMALRIAKILNAANDGTLVAKQQAGSMVRKLKGFITHTIHDAETLKSTGFENWFNKMVGTEDNHGGGLLDTDRSFGVWNREQIKEAMKEDFNNIIRGYNEKLVPDGVSDKFITARGQSENMARSQARSRTYHFKDGYAWADYNSEFGSKNLMESVLSDVHRSTKQAALMRQFGTNPDAGFQSAVIRLKAKYEADGNEKAVQTMNELSQRFNDMYNTTRGVSDIRGTSAAANASHTLMTIEAMGKLGMLVPRGLRDFASGSFLLRDINGKSWGQNLVSMLHEYLQNFKDSGERQHNAESMSLAVEHLLGDAYNRFGAGDQEPGMLGKAAETFFRFAQAPIHFDSIKNSAATVAGWSMARDAHLPYADLPPRMKVTLDRYGINAEHWEGIRQGVLELKPGVKAITAEGVSNVDPEHFGSMAVKHDAEVRFGTMMNDLADSASNTHGDRQKWFMLRGTKDEGHGIILRLLSQFKLPMLQQFDNLRRVTMSSDPTAAPQSMQDAVMSRSGAATLAQFLALGTVLGYAGQSVVDLAQGKTPADPTKKETWANAAIRGGTLGLAGDFLLGEANRNNGKLDSGVRALAGPVLSDAYTLLSEVGRPLLHGQTKGTGKAAFDVAYQNLPFHNLWYAKTALDQLIFNQVKESLSPNRAQRTENFTHKQGQDYWLDAARPTKALGVGQ